MQIQSFSFATIKHFLLIFGCSWSGIADPFVHLSLYLFYWKQVQKDFNFNPGILAQHLKDTKDTWKMECVSVFAK